MCCWSLKVVKCAVLVLNILYIITGLILFITGIVIVASSAYGEILPGIAYLNAAGLLIFVGIVIFISAVVGCCLQDTKCCVLTFYFLVVVVICLEVSVIILGYIANGKLRERVDDYSNQEMLRGMAKYDSDDGLKEAWDQVQREERCCGVHSPSDWYNGIYGKRAFEENQLPDSCCEIEKNGCGLEKVPKHSRACGEFILDTVHNKLRSLATITLLCLLIQVVLVVFILCWYYILFRNKTVHWCCSCCVYEMVEIEDDEKHTKLKSDSV